EGAVGLEHEQANSFRETCRETACVENVAPSNEQTHPRTVLSVSDRARREGRSFSATDTNNSPLVRSPALTGLRRREERAGGRSAWLAQKADRVIARRHVRNDERQSCYA